MDTRQSTGPGEAPLPTITTLGSEEARQEFLNPARNPRVFERVAAFHGYTDLADPDQLQNAQTKFDALSADPIAWHHYLDTLFDQADSQEMRLERRINQKTRLPNDVAFWEDLPSLVQQSAKNNQGIALIFCDVNGFKNINDRLGYDVGDELIKIVMATVQESLREGDAHVYHISGDECVIIVPDLPDVEDFESVAVPLTGRHATNPDWQRGTEQHTNPERVMAIRTRVRKALHEKAFVGKFAGYDLDLATGAAISAGKRKKGPGKLFVDANADMHQDKEMIKDATRRQWSLKRRFFKAAGDLCHKLAGVHDDRK